MFNNKNTFNLRFYGCTTDQVEECIKRLKDAGAKIISHRIGKLKLSVNYKIPKSCYQAVVTFASDKDRSEFMSNEECKKIYISYAPKGSKLRERKPGDTSYSH